MTDFSFIRAGEVTIRALVKGHGPLVVLVHGFPESWHSWRFQIDAIADAGYTVCAIDVRGYGGSDKPTPISAYAMQHLVDDVLGVARALQPDAPAILIGHDWGAPIVWHTALSAPEAISAVAGLSVPHIGLPRRPFSEVYRTRFSDQGTFFYQEWFEVPGRAEAEAEADIAGFLRRMYGGTRVDAPRGASFLDAMTDPGSLPAWLKPDDFAYYVAEFESSGFRGPMNRYRNHELDFEWLSRFTGQKILQPALFIGGDKDPASSMFGLVTDIKSRILDQVPNLTSFHMLQDTGHWIQQERPEEVNRLLLGWLAGLGHT